MGYFFLGYIVIFIITLSLCKAAKLGDRYIEENNKEIDE